MREATRTIVRRTARKSIRDEGTDSCGANPGSSSSLRINPAQPGSANNSDHSRFSHSVSLKYWVSRKSKTASVAEKEKYACRRNSSSKPARYLEKMPDGSDSSVGTLS